MQVSKWGNSLAVRLPAVVVEALDLKEGDEIEISIAGKRDFFVVVASVTGPKRRAPLDHSSCSNEVRSFLLILKFNREEINER